MKIKFSNLIAYKCLWSTFLYFFLQNTLESQCQYEIYTLYIVETLVIISGTLPMIIMTFGALYDFFQKESYEMKKLSFNHDDNFYAEHDNRHPYYHHHRRSTVGSGISGRSTNSQSQNYRDEGSSRLSSSFKQLANICCDCDYYFCCLANIQRRLNPYAAKILNSRRFKVCVLLVVSLDFLCMIILLWFSNTRGEDIDFSFTWLITYCLKVSDQWLLFCIKLNVCFMLSLHWLTAGN